MYTFTKLHDRPIPNVGVGVGPVEFQLMSVHSCVSVCRSHISNAADKRDWRMACRFEMESRADFDGGICCVARADPMFFNPEESMTCEYVELTEVEFDYIENEELIAHIIEISADVPKVRVRIRQVEPLSQLQRVFRSSCHSSQRYNLLCYMQRSDC